MTVLDVVEGDSHSPARPSTTTGPPPCNQTSCAACAATPGCGWCTERGTCIQGDAAAPCASDECAAALYSGQSCTASGIACASLTNCFDCATVDGCGWCGADAQCVADYDDGRASHCKGPEREYVNDVGKCDAGLNDQRRVARRLFGRR